MLKSKMTEAKQERAIEKAMLQMEALNDALYHLRKRMMKATENEVLLIKMEMARLVFKVDAIFDRLVAFKNGTGGLTAPSADAIEDMKKAIKKMEKANVKGRKAKAIIAAAIAIAGNLPKSKVSK